ncbi:MAG: cation transporting ATPase C-terminal domain-containing protein [Candidatus Peribacteria bacterium]|nr:MAG: cation transporting ATPase C-terminal domain-containing protein [Candidatus Peribacteria bacterium]
MLYVYVLHQTGDLVLARSVCFVTFGINSLVYVFSIRTLSDPIWSNNPLSNKWLLLAVAGGM